MNREILGNIANQGAKGTQPWPVEVVKNPAQKYASGNKFTYQAFNTNTASLVAGTAVNIVEIFANRDNNRIVRLQSVIFCATGGSAGTFQIRLIRNTNTPPVGGGQVTPVKFDLTHPASSVTAFQNSTPQAVVFAPFRMLLTPVAGNTIFTFSAADFPECTPLTINPNEVGTFVCDILTVSAITTAPQVTANMYWSEELV